MKHFVLIIILLAPFQLIAEYQSLGIVGDSLTTGASSNPRLKLSLHNILFDTLPSKDTPKGLSRSQLLLEENLYTDLGINYSRILRLKNPNFVHPTNSDIQMSIKYLDSPIRSFGYLVGRALKMAPENISLAGVDGYVVATGWPQMLALSQWQNSDFEFEIKTTGTVEEKFQHAVDDLLQIKNSNSNSSLPELVLMSFTANDMCQESIFNKSPEQVYNEYFSYLSQTYEKTQQKIQPAANGTKIVFVGGLNPIQIFTNPEVLNKKVYFDQYLDKVEDHWQNILKRDVQKYSCEEIRAMDDKQVLKFAEGMCPALLATRPGQTQRMQHLEAIWQAISKAQKDATELAQQNKTKGFEYQYVGETSLLRLKNDEVSNDCFHPSLKGHARIAKIILQSL